MRTHTATIVATGLAFPECARWRDGRWWCADMHAGTVLSWPDDLTTGPVVELALTAPDGSTDPTVVRTAGIGFLPDGRLLAVEAISSTVRRREVDGRVVVHADLAAATAGWCNDMLVDHRGRAYVGSYGADLGAGAGRAEVRLALVEPDGRTRSVGEPLAFPNGMAITPDGTTIVVAESLAERLTAFAVGADGTLADRRCWATLPSGVRPDGIALDPTGGVWVASFTTGECLRVEAGGRVTDRVQVPGRVPFACAWGGGAADTLLVCAARTWHADETVAERAGVLAVVRPG